MSANNLFIRFRNGGSAEYFVEAKSNLETFLSDYQRYLNSGKGQAGKYRVFANSHRMLLVVDFSAVESVAISD